MKYLISLVALVVVVVGYFVLVPANSPPTPEPEPSASAPAAPVATTPDEVAPDSPDEETLLENMAADLREGLPSAVGDTLKMTDALFLPRMRIMEFNYVTTAADVGASARDMRTLIDSRAETICLENREMFEMGATLRNSFEDRDGNLLQRVYLLPEQCRAFY